MKPPARTEPNSLRLFWSFTLIGALGFGGVLPWARYMLVEKRGWMDDAGFAELFTLGQFFPGPNIANVGVIYGRRTNGWQGASAAVCGLYLCPTITTILAGLLIQRWWGNRDVQQIFGAVMPIASGLMLGTALRLTKAMPRELGAFAILALTFVLMAVVKLPLWLVLAICLPATMAVAFWGRRHG